MATKTYTVRVDEETAGVIDALRAFFSGLEISSGEEPAPEAAADPSPRRRRSAAAETEQPSTPASQPSNDPAPTRRRRSVEQPAPATEEPAPTSAPTRRARGAATPAATTSSPSETASDGSIPDAELSKAASLAAEKITPAKVQEIIAEFGVRRVSQIVPDARREFLDALKEACG